MCQLGGIDTFEGNLDKPGAFDRPLQSGYRQHEMCPQDNTKIVRRNIY